MEKLSKVNLFLHGFPDPAIHIYDTLSNDADFFATSAFS